MVKVNMKNFLKGLPPERREIFEKGWIHNYALEPEELVSQYNFGSITFADTTCRDGEQMPGVVFTPEQKLEIVHMLGDVGITLVEIGYPGVSKDEVKACKMIAENVPKAICFVMSRANKRDIDAAIEAEAKALDLFTSCSEFHVREKMGLDPETNITKYLELLDYALDHGMGIIFGMEDISRSDLDYYVRIVKTVKEAAGSRWLGTGISDTTSAFTPRSAAWFYLEAKKRFAAAGEPDISLGMHFHNDFGLASANTLAVMEVGAAAAQGTVLGIGERCGNTPIEEVLVALKVIYGYKMRGIDFEKLVELCELVSKYSGIPIPVNKPIVGLNAFRHESGIHAHGVLKNKFTYEIIPSEMLGKKSIFDIGKFSGTASVLQGVLEPQGIKPNKEQLYKITMAVKEAHEEKMRGKMKQSKEDFVKTYQDYMKAMVLPLKEVLEIAKKIMNE
ncbi:MAG: homoaconitate hydratase [Candidatus Lokiarchaeota archaeon]|nr:homoaconitate hydratase [Candidatus Lokiarchaeota archaeon]